VAKLQRRGLGAVAQKILQFQTDGDHTREQSGANGTVGGHVAL
jgi:hypothetical protein